MTDLPFDMVIARVETSEVDFAEVQGQIVAWDGSREVLHLLDPLGSLLFQLADGESSLRVTIDEISAECGQHRDELQSKVRIAVLNLLRAQLVRVVETGVDSEEPAGSGQRALEVERDA